MNTELNTILISSIGTLLPGAMEIDVIAFVIIAFLLILCLIMFFVYQTRFRETAKELAALTEELGATRERLTETGQELENSRNDQKATEERYSTLLFDARVGMFQIDAFGKCVYLNNAMQDLSGLYPKKALKEGLDVAIHGDDREKFNAEWEAFTRAEETQADFSFRFQHSKNRVLHARCHAQKVFDARKEIECYIGWVVDDSSLHERQDELIAETRRYESFTTDGIEGFFRLAPEAPIAMKGEPAEIAAKIMKHVRLIECSDTFAATHGAKAADLIGKSIGDLRDGCGPFRVAQDFRDFVDSNYAFIERESTRQDASGNLLNLLNTVIGIVEDDHLVGLWGSHRNISQQKRERAELINQAGFLKRIINSLPGDVHVKDTRCRYLYASRKLSERTGIPQEDWLGKTIFEVMPGTPREHDQRAIETMKSGEAKRWEHAIQNRGKTRWMETIQTPLISSDELVEGVIALSVDTTERHEKEEESRLEREKLRHHIEKVESDLSDARTQRAKTAEQLAESLEREKTLDSNHALRERELQEQVKESERVEARLRESERELIERQERLAERLKRNENALALESDKRKKWEELISIKEDELRKAEERASTSASEREEEERRRRELETDAERIQHDLENARDELRLSKERNERERETLKSELAAEHDAESKAKNRAEKKLESVEAYYQDAQEQIKRMTDQYERQIDELREESRSARQDSARDAAELEEISRTKTGEIETLRAEFETSLKDEKKARAKAERSLKKTTEFLEAAQDRIKTMTGQYADALEKETAERKASELESREHANELEQLRRSFSERIEEETKFIKQELAKKQIQEKALRQREKEMAQRVNELEHTVKSRTEAFEKQLKSNEEAVNERKRIAEQFEDLTRRQHELVERETEKLNLDIAEIRLEEVRLREQASELGRAKKQLEKTLETRVFELEAARHRIKELEERVADGAAQA